MFDDVVQGVGTHEAFGRSWVDEDAMHLVALHEVESVKRVTLLGVVDDVSGVVVDLVVRSLLMVMGFRRRF